MLTPHIDKTEISEIEIAKHKISIKAAQHIEFIDWQRVAKD
jgi:hypothetical protein